MQEFRARLEGPFIVYTHVHVIVCNACILHMCCFMLFASIHVS